VYKEILDLLTEGQKERLKIAQREWVEYRDKKIENYIAKFIIDK